MIDEDESVRVQKGGSGIWAVVPLKEVAAAKQRLASVLTVAERQRLVEAMARDVVSALDRASSLDGVLIISRDPLAAELATNPKIEVIEEADGGDLNDAINEALGHLCNKGAHKALVIPADIPLVSDKDIEALMANAGEGVCLSPAKGDEGTNALIFPLNSDFSVSYGPGSFLRHKNQAEQLGLPLKIIEESAFSLDVDRPEEFEEILQCRVTFEEASHTREFLDRYSRAEIQGLADRVTLSELMRKAADKRDRAFGGTITYSRKVFIPLTQLCRDVCHYCTFAKTPKTLGKPYLSVEECIEIAREGVSQGCQEALFTLGEKPELRYQARANLLMRWGLRAQLIISLMSQREFLRRPVFSPTLIRAV